MGKRLEQILRQTRYAGGKYTHVEMLGVTGRLGSAVEATVRPPTRPGTTGIGTPGPRAAEGLGVPEARLLGLTCLPSTRLSAPTGRRAPRTRTAAPGCPARLPAAGRGCCGGLLHVD